MAPDVSQGFSHEILVKEDSLNPPSVKSVYFNTSMSCIMFKLPFKYDKADVFKICIKT